MPRPFLPLAIDQFARILARPLQRRIVEVHMHHTWRPNHAMYRGLASIEAMYQFHTGPQNKWSDIAQHVTIAPMEPSGPAATGIARRPARPAPTALEGRAVHVRNHRGLR